MTKLRYLHRRAAGHFLRTVFGVGVISTAMIGPSIVMADSFNYTAGATCVARTANHEKNIVRNANSLVNKSRSAYVQVYCSGPGVEFSRQANARFIIYGKQGDTTRFFKAAFRLFRPDDGQKLAQEFVRAPSTPEAEVKFGTSDPLVGAHCCAYNQVQVWIPPRSVLYNVYSVYEDSKPTEYKAYVWAGSESTDSYIPIGKFNYNSTGTENSVRRFSTGRYAVKLGGVGGSDGLRGNVQVSAFTNKNSSCRSGRWAGSPDVEVWVYCYDTDGNPADTKFSLLYNNVE